MRKTFKPADVFISDKDKDRSRKDVVSVKFEIPAVFNSWILFDSGTWSISGTINLSTILSTNTYEVRESSRNRVTNRMIAESLYNSIISASVSLALPNIDTPIKTMNICGNKIEDSTYFSKIKNSLSVGFSIDADFADRNGKFFLVNTMRIYNPSDNMNDPGKFLAVDTGKSASYYLDDCYVVVTIDFDIAEFHNIIENTVAVYKNNHYCIFGITTDSNTGIPRINRYNEREYLKRKTTVSCPICSPVQFNTDYLDE